VFDVQIFKLYTFYNITIALLQNIYQSLSHFDDQPLNKPVY